MRKDGKQADGRYEQRFETIVIANLNVSGMAKSGLAGDGRDCGWYEIGRQLE
jgi:hypothetical protein